MLRKARLKDSSTIFKWRNHPEVAKWSGSGQEVAPYDHYCFIMRSLYKGNPLILIEPGIGVVHVEEFLDDPGIAHGVVSIFLNPDRIGQGHGFPLLSDALSFVQRAWPHVGKYTARIQGENMRSRAIFTKAGFKQFALNEGKFDLILLPPFAEHAD